MTNKNECFFSDERYLYSKGFLLIKNKKKLKDEKFIRTKGRICVKSLFLKVEGKLIRAKIIQIMTNYNALNGILYRCELVAVQVIALKIRRKVNKGERSSDKRQTFVH